MGPWSDKVSFLIRRDIRELLLSLSPALLLDAKKRSCEHPVRQWLSVSRKKSLTSTWPCWLLDLDFQPPELWEVNFHWLWANIPSTLLKIFCHCDAPTELPKTKSGTKEVLGSEYEEGSECNFDATLKEVTPMHKYMFWLVSIIKLISLIYMYINVLSLLEAEYF